MLSSIAIARVKTVVAEKTEKAAVIKSLQSVRYYTECQVRDCLKGEAFSAGASLDVGTQPNSFGFGGTGKKSTNRQFEDYGGPYGQVNN